MTDLEQLYQEVLLDHHRAPRNAGRLEDPSHQAEAHNPLCGDRAVVTLLVEGQCLVAARCDVTGCAICRASGSMMTEAIIGRPLADVLASSAAFFELVAGHEAAPGRAAGPPRTTVEEGALQPLRVFEQVRAFPSRQRCATLCWETLSKALAGT